MHAAGPNNPLHGITLETMVTQLHAHYGWEGLGERIRIMLDSTKLLYNPDTMRNYTLSEYILKTP